MRTVRSRARAATFVTTVVLTLIACSISLLVVRQAWSATQASTHENDRAVAARVAADLAGQFETALADDPTFYERHLFFAERPRVCTTPSGTTTVVASGDPAAAPVSWPAACGPVWGYVDAGTSTAGYDPTQVVSRLQISPPTATAPDLRITVLAAVGQVEAGLTRTYTVPSAATLSLYSQTGVDLDQLAGATGTVKVAGTVYTVGASSTPSRPEQTDATTGIGPLQGAFLASECGFSGPAGGAAQFWRATSATDQTAAGCTGTPTDPAPVADVRELAPLALTTAGAARSVVATERSVCDPAIADMNTSVPAGQPDAGTWSSALCLQTGRWLVDANGTPVQVNAPGGQPPVAYRLHLDGTTVSVDVAASAPNDPADQAAATTALAAGTHPLSATGPVWSVLGTFAAPRTGVLVTDASVYVGSCTAALGGSDCTTQQTSVPLTVIAGTPLVPADVTVAGPVGAGTGAALGLVATGSVHVAFYARTPGADLTLATHLFALGAGLPAGTQALVSQSVAGADGGVLHVSGTLAASSLGPLFGWTAVHVDPGATPPPGFVTFTSFWHPQAAGPFDAVGTCGAARCAATW